MAERVYIKKITKARKDHYCPICDGDVIEKDLPYVKASMRVASGYYAQRDFCKWHPWKEVIEWMRSHWKGYLDNVSH